MAMVQLTKIDSLSIWPFPILCSVRESNPIAANEYNSISINHIVSSNVSQVLKNKEFVFHAVQQNRMPLVFKKQILYCLIASFRF